jgi:hypothetical protein
MSQDSNRQRKSYLILPEFQWKMVAYALGLSALIMMVLYGANLYFIEGLRSEGLAAGLQEDHPFFLFLSEQSRFLDLIFIVVAVVVNLLVVLGGLWISNRIAGPIYRVETSLRQLAEGGRLQPISFRKRDFFPDLVALVNKLADRQPK